MDVVIRTRITHNRMPEIMAAFPGATSAVVRKTTLDIQASAQNNAPVKTGVLKGSIQAEVTEFSGIVSTSIEYGVYQEYGTRHMPAQQFMRPAADEHEPKFVEAMEQMARSL
ncbi:MAG TPA: hypothetical protein PKD55_13500 [Bellilinea sp.]|nr:hypothetical protein [Bellilinea sp.]